MTSSPSVEIYIEEKKWSAKKLGLEKLCLHSFSQAWDIIGKKNKASPHISILFTNNNKIKKLNKSHRKKDKPTNILSFQIWDDVDALPKTGSIPAGDLVLAFETIIREAEEKNISVKNHLTHLLIHGFLHLFGYDHMNDQDALKMENLEIKILRKMGINNPYKD